MMNSADKTTLKDFTKELTILHYGLTFGALVVLFLIYFFMVKDGHFNFSDTTDYFFYICPLIAIAGIYGGSYMYRNKVAGIKSESTLEEKLVILRAATVGKLSLIEGPALICALALMETQNLLYLIIALALIVYMYSQKISEEKIREELGLK